MLRQGGQKGISATSLGSAEGFERAQSVYSTSEKQREQQGSYQEEQTRIAAALKEVKRGVAEFVRVRRKKLHGFFRQCRGELQGHRQEGNRVSSLYLGISEGVAEFPSGMADKSCSGYL